VLDLNTSLEEKLSDVLWDMLGKEEVIVDIDWAAMEIPELKGKRAQEDEEVIFEEEGEIMEGYEYGCNNLEA
jgi:hypothetical protein